MNKRIFALLMAVALVLTFAPIAPIAAEAAGEAAAKPGLTDNLGEVTGEHTATCPVCEAEVVWKPVAEDTYIISTGATGAHEHYYLEKDLNKTQQLQIATDNEVEADPTKIEADGKITVCLNLNGHKITSADIGINVTWGSTLNLLGTGEIAAAKTGALYLGTCTANVYADVKLTSAAGTVINHSSGGTANTYLGPKVVADGQNTVRTVLWSKAGELKIDGATIMNGYIANGNGGNICMTAGSIVMERGTIKNGEAAITTSGSSAYGDNLYVGANTSFTMRSGRMEFTSDYAGEATTAQNAFVVGGKMWVVGDSVITGGKHGSGGGILVYSSSNTTLGTLQIGGTVNLKNFHSNGTSRRDIILTGANNVQRAQLIVVGGYATTMDANYVTIVKSFSATTDDAKNPALGLTYADGEYLSSATNDWIICRGNYTGLLKATNYSAGWIVPTNVQSVTQPLGETKTYNTKWDTTTDAYAVGNGSGTSIGYPTLEAAVARVASQNTSMYLLLTKNEGKITLPIDMNIDLNGCTVDEIVTGEYKLGLMDNANNDYTTENCGKVTKIDNAANLRAAAATTTKRVEAEPTHKCYLPVVDGTSVTAHRYEADVKAYLRTAAETLAFQSSFKADAVLREKITGLGMNIYGIPTGETKLQKLTGVAYADEGVTAGAVADMQANGAYDAAYVVLDSTKKTWWDEDITTKAYIVVDGVEYEGAGNTKCYQTVVTELYNEGNEAVIEMVLDLETFEPKPGYEFLNEVV